MSKIKQQEIFNFVEKYTSKNKYAPSLEEIREHFNFASVSTAHYHIKNLEDAGLLRKQGNKARAITLDVEEKMVQVPILGTISAGSPIEAIEDRQETVAISQSAISGFCSSDIYALRVQGQSMIEEGVNDGDIVIILSRISPANGDKVVALIRSEEVTLKKFYREKERIRLQPANHLLTPIYVNPDELTIQGRVLMTVKTAGKIKPVPLIKNPLPHKSLTSHTANTLFEVKKQPKFPSTRFQGSKAKLLHQIWEQVKDINFESAIDLFGGTGSVGYMLKSKGKQVFYNDYLQCNYLAGLALIENSKEILDENDIDFILSVHSNIDYPDFIQKTFQDTYFTDQENKWLDIVSTNIRQMKNKYKQALAYYALFQSCIIKRPYNLFHRKNLYVRFANVERSFGNKSTWDKPFEDHFINFAKEANDAVFDNKQKNKAFNHDAVKLPAQADLVYVDTPYISNKGSAVDYLDFYHFLEGVSDYPRWYNKIDYKSKHRKFKTEKSVWADKKRITDAFDQLFKKYKDSILVVSYRSDGVPSPEELAALLKKYKKEVREVFRNDYKYALSKNGDSKEVLIIAQ
ncbi:MAG: repressor LexA [Parcubacteria group bacterium]|nr:repressor LexA [Parcubacteria group bacterium]